MPRFIFRLQGVLRQRRQIERQKQRDLAIAQAQQQQMEQELRNVNDAMKTATEQLRRDHLSGPIDVTYLTAHRRFIVAMQRKGQSLVQRIAQQQRVTDAARLALVEAAKQRKAIEKLRERRWEQWLADQNRRETIELDEISQQMAVAEQLERSESGV